MCNSGQWSRTVNNQCKRERPEYIFGPPDKTLSSIRELLSDRDTLIEDRKRYQTQPNDQKNFMDARDYRRKSRMWEAVIRTINQQLEFIDSELAVSPSLKMSPSLKIGQL